MKYFKLIDNNMIIGVVTSSNFMKYLPIPDCYARANEETGEFVAYRGKFYRSTWMRPYQKPSQYTEVNIINITEEEYNILFESLKENEEIVNPEQYEEEEREEYIDPMIIGTIEFVRTSKLNEMSRICRTTIESGIDLEIRGETKHFSLTTQDQLNLISAQTMAQTQTLIPYHADGEETDFYTNEEINQIAEAAAAFKVQHTTYYNSLKTYINALETIEEISAITYGVEIPDEYKSDVLKVLEQ